MADFNREIDIDDDNAVFVMRTDGTFTLYLETPKGSLAVDFGIKYARETRDALTESINDAESEGF